MPIDGLKPRLLIEMGQLKLQDLQGAQLTKLVSFTSTVGLLVSTPTVTSHVLHFCVILGGTCKNLLVLLVSTVEKRSTRILSHVPGIDLRRFHWG